MNKIRDYRLHRVADSILIAAMFSLSLWTVSCGSNASSQCRVPGCNTPPPPSPTATPTPLPPALAQRNFQWQDDTHQANDVSFSSSVTTGDLILVAVSYYQGAITSVSDSQGNSYTPVTTDMANASPNTDFVALYFAKDAKGGSTTVNVSLSQTADSNVGVYEFRGLSTISPLDHLVSKSGTGSTPNGGSIATTSDPELLFVLSVDDNANVDLDNGMPPKAGSGYTLLDHNDDYTEEKFYAEYRIATPGTYQTNFTIAPSNADWVVIGASFK